MQLEREMALGILGSREVGAAEALLLTPQSPFSAAGANYPLAGSACELPFYYPFRFSGGRKAKHICCQKGLGLVYRKRDYRRIVL